MGHPTDLHPADTAAREVLQAKLVAAREALGWTKKQLAAQLDLSPARVRDLERPGRTRWRLGTVQQWAAGVERRLTWQCWGLPEPADPDATTLILRASRPGLDRDRALLVDELRRRRHACGITLRPLAALIGVTESSLSEWEQCADGVLVAAVQRHARALGGVLRLDLTSDLSSKEKTDHE